MRIQADPQVRCEEQKNALRTKVRSADVTVSRRAEAAGRRRSEGGGAAPGCRLLGALLRRAAKAQLAFAVENRGDFKKRHGAVPTCRHSNAEL